MTKYKLRLVEKHILSVYSKMGIKLFDEQKVRIKKLTGGIQ